MSNKVALGSLKKTNNAILSIRKALLPFLDILSNNSKLRQKPSVTHDSNSAEIAEAEAAVALTIGTLRYMAARLEGRDKGPKSNDPLRLELDKMRKILVTLGDLNKKLKGGGEEEGKKKRKCRDEKEIESVDNSKSKKKK